MWSRFSESLEAAMKAGLTANTHITRTVKEPMGIIDRNYSTFV